MVGTARAMIEKITLNNGLVALVDEEDYPDVVPFTWTAWKPNDIWYAVSGTGFGRGGLITMHRLITDADTGLFVDHINGDGLDNRRCNLRVCTPTQNAYNKAPQQGKLYSKYKGVTWFKRDNKWKAQIMKDGKNYHLGYFADELDAALAYDKAARKEWGEFAKTNF